MRNIVLIALLISALSFGQNKPKNDWQNAKLRGKVKTAGQVEYYANEKGNLEQLGQNFVASFNKKGYITNMTIKSLDNEMRLVMERDEKANKKVIKSYDEKGNVSFTNVQELNSKGFPLVERGLIDDGFESFKNTYKYDEKGNVIEKVMLQGGNLFLKVVYSYNKKERTIEEKNYNIKNTLDQTIITKNDKTGKRIEVSSYAGNGTLEERYTFKYDKYGNEIEQNAFSPDGKLLEKKTYTYEFDKRKNWTKKSEYTDGVLTMVTEQNITYY